MTVPHGVARTPSVSSRPLTIVVATPVARLIFWSAGSSLPSSFAAIRYVGDDCGQSTIWSRFGPAFPAETTFAFRPSECDEAGRVASAWASFRSAVDDAATGLLTPKSCSVSGQPLFGLGAEIDGHRGSDDASCHKQQGSAEPGPTRSARIKCSSPT